MVLTIPILNICHKCLLFPVLTHHLLFLTPYSSILKRKLEDLVIADFGCGEARLAHALSSSCRKVYSFDLVALNDKVTVCDFTKTPLENESIDIAVFCLSLMGTNIK